MDTTTGLEFLILIVTIGAAFGMLSLLRRALGLEQLEQSSGNI